MEVHSWEYHRVITRLTLTSSMGRIAQDVIVKLLSDHRAAMSKLTANEIQFVRSQLEVPDAPHEPCERVAACIAQWNRLPLAKLADSIEQFEWVEGYNKVHQAGTHHPQHLLPFLVHSKINQDTTEWFFELGCLDDNNL